MRYKISQENICDGDKREIQQQNFYISMFTAPHNYQMQSSRVESTTSAM